MIIVSTIFIFNIDNWEIIRLNVQWQNKFSTICCHYEIKVSFTLSVAGVKHIVLIGHCNCGKVNIASKKNLFIAKFSKNGGLILEKIEAGFNNYAPMFEINNEIDYTLNEATRFCLNYPKTIITHLYDTVKGNLH